ncbi:MAG: class I SAM-dependent methyltransferase [Deltaproteobacteria bacterium]|jgi:SAM-dependent methyltransferase|nr:class I SAM-dependent methyltransferase [Deltaproteobacteria bacterium]
MLRDPYRQLFFEANAASHKVRVGEGGLSWPDNVISERINPGLGSRLLVAGLTAPEIIPALRLRLGLTGQLVILDPSAEALGAVTQNDAFWSVILKAGAERIPVMDSCLDAILCWSSFMALGPLGQITDEFFRVLAPGGKVFITYDRLALSKGPRPCLTGLQALFLKTGFARMDAEDDGDFFLFRAEKVPGFGVAHSRMGRA